MDQVLTVMVISVLLGAVIALSFFTSYFGKRRSEVQSIAKAESQSDPKKHQRPPQPKKSHSKAHSHSAADKDQNKRHHPLDLNTLKGHGDSVTGICFSFDGRSLATACADGVVRVFKLEDASSRGFKFLRINLPAGGHPTAVAFSDDVSSIVVASQTLTGSSLYMYGEEKPKASNETKQQPKLPLPEIKWEHHKVHEKRAILTLVGTTASFGSADGSTILVSCSEGTDIMLWHGRTGKILGNVDTNQLKNNMAAISPNGRFIAAAAFTADVKKVLLEVAIRKGSISGEKRKMFTSNRLVYTKTLCGPFIRCTTMREKMHLIPSAMQFYPVSKTKGMSSPKCLVWEIVYSKDGSVKEVLKAM